MEVKTGDYYRRTEDGLEVKLIHTEVFPGGAVKGPPAVIYRLNQDEFPHRYEWLWREAFERDFEGPLKWDPVEKKFL